MLDSLKKLSRSWVSQLLLLLLVISFGVWGVADIFTGFGSNTVATVGNVEISANEFARRYDLTVTQLSRQFGKQFTPEEARQLGLPS
jgi:peptidyl-prolyl cis-trans isomerase D